MLELKFEERRVESKDVYELKESHACNCLDSLCRTVLTWHLYIEGLDLSQIRSSILTYATSGCG